MDGITNNVVQFSKGINLREMMMASGSEFHIDLDFKKKPGNSLCDDGLLVSSGDESDSEDVMKTLSESAEKMLLCCPEYHTFADLATKMVDCMPSGDVKMLIFEEGDGPLVPLDAEVTFHYAAYWEKAKIPFDSTLTMNQGQPIQVKLQTGGMLPGLEVGLTAVKGPSARLMLLLQPAVTWGPRGAPPRIKPEPALFVVALYDVRDTQAAHRFNDLPQEEQRKFDVTMRTVKSIHKLAKDYFTKKRYQKALAEYQQSIYVLNLSRPETFDEENEVKQYKVKVFLNLAMCYYHIGKPKYVIKMLESLDSYIDVDNNCKALFYYGRAYQSLGNMDLAMEFYKKSLVLEPKNKDIGKALNELHEYMKISSKNEKEMWKTVFKSDKKESVVVDEEFQNGVRDIFEELSKNDDCAKFNLPPSLSRNEVDFVKELAEQFQGFRVLEEGEGGKKKVTLVKRQRI